MRVTEEVSFGPYTESGIVSKVGVTSGKFNVHLSSKLFSKSLSTIGVFLFVSVGCGAPVGTEFDGTSDCRVGNLFFPIGRFLSLNAASSCASLCTISSAREASNCAVLSSSFFYVAWIICGHSDRDRVPMA
eukprot:TRINITY_DN9542_c0_g1_i1.p1 TRINITY_DN9542_c0_g1~~TRINITY_DN9542_c0_g1_i1.p1  ORF type:complete len:131 (-),score=16.65 TRINITY_DN9542_c0_g1_i1:9-401(-)